MIPAEADWGYNVTRWDNPPVDCLVLDFENDAIVLFPGLSTPELKWIAQQFDSILPQQT